MKGLLRSGLAFGLFSALATAATWNGYLMDAMCSKEKDPASHTRQCVLGCAKSGLGLLTADGKYLKFDPAGSEKALAALKATKKQNDLKVKVDGTLEGDTLTVNSIVVQ